jgi:hypothetical protein
MILSLQDILRSSDTLHIDRISVLVPQDSFLATKIIEVGFESTGEVVEYRGWPHLVVVFVPR